MATLTIEISTILDKYPDIYFDGYKLIDVQSGKNIFEINSRTSHPPAFFSDDNNEFIIIIYDSIITTYSCEEKRMYQICSHKCIELITTQIYDSNTIDNIINLSMYCSSFGEKYLLINNQRMIDNERNNFVLLKFTSWKEQCQNLIDDIKCACKIDKNIIVTSSLYHSIYYDIYNNKNIHHTRNKFLDWTKHADKLISIEHQDARWCFLQEQKILEKLVFMEILPEQQIILNNLEI